MRLTDDKNRMTEDRVKLKVIGYALTPNIKYFKTRDIGKRFGITYMGSSKVADIFNILVNKKFIEFDSEGKAVRSYFIRNRKGLEELYHEIVWRNV